MEIRELLFENGQLGMSEIERPPARWIHHRYLILVFRLLLAVVFIYAALQKIDKPRMFADEIKMYEALGDNAFVYLIAVILPWVELFCGLSLLTGWFIRGSALILFVFNAVFIVVITVRTVGIMSTKGTAFMDVYFDCGCGFGVTYAWKKLIEDSIFLIAALAILTTPLYRFRLLPFRRKR